MADLKQRLAAIIAHQTAVNPFDGRRGVEREALRVSPDGSLALSTHPSALGSALTHPYITTDYAEPLVELITPPVGSAEELVAWLEDIHTTTYAGMGDELLWCHSMPCPLPDEMHIPIARYGVSHLGTLKHVYRKGLAFRYGKAMQCIAGIHYNFSVPEAFWKSLHAEQGPGMSLRDVQSEGYMAAIRNFHRYSWLLMLLFGASPALASSFMGTRKSDLVPLSEDTLALPYATSLRMSDLGYQNSAQSGIAVSVNSLDEYLQDLSRVVSQPHPPYARYGTLRQNEWMQINPNILQIENEFYSTIRPKQVCRSGERPINALRERGVQYLEVRCMDIDPFTPVGISSRAAQFLDAFLYQCLLKESPPNTPSECKENTANFSRVVTEGRRPGLVLQKSGTAVPMATLARELLHDIRIVAEAMDNNAGGNAFVSAVDLQIAKLDDPTRLPSHRVMQEMAACGNSFVAFGLKQSVRHASYFRSREMSAVRKAEFEHLAATSLREQAELEERDVGSFDEYIAQFNNAITPDPAPLSVAPARMPAINSTTRVKSPLAQTEQGRVS